MINFIRAYNAIMETVRRRGLDCRQQSVLLGIFTILNEERFPAGMVAISNKRLIYSTGLDGSRPDAALREVRRQLAGMGLISFAPGDRNHADPEYRIEWAAMGLTEDSAQDSAHDSAHVSASKKCANNNIDVYPEVYININDKERDARAREESPAAEEIREYAAGLGFDLNPLKFVDYYASRGTKLADWRAAVRNWQRREAETARNGPKRRVSAQEYAQRDYSEAELERKIRKIM